MSGGPFPAVRCCIGMSSGKTRDGDVLFWVLVTAASAVWVVVGATLSGVL
jgi:hypothetical protein